MPTDESLDPVDPAVANVMLLSHCAKQRLDEESRKGGVNVFHFVLGVTLSLLASIFSNVGLNLQKYSAIKERRRPSGLVRSYTKQPIWWIGLFCIFFFSLGDFAALAFISQSVAAPLGGSTMVTNVILAHWWLDEPLTQRDALGVGITLVGLSLIGVFGSRSSQCYTMDELTDKATEAGVLAYAFVTAALLLVFFFGARQLRRRRLNLGQYSSLWVKRWSKLERFLLPALSGLLGGQTVLLAKALAEIVQSQSSGEPQLQLPGVWLLLAAMIAFIAMQVHWMSVAMKFYDNMYLQPVFQSFFLGSATLGGVVCFKELVGVRPLARFMFILGMGLLLLGVVVLSGRRQLGLPPLRRFRAAVIAVMFATHLIFHKLKWKTRRLAFAGP
eukprot:SAG31_NODE_337_length_17493_cov_5.855755_12_plen_386_part_00